MSDPERSPSRIEDFAAKVLALVTEAVPLAVPSSPRWADCALARPLELLDDHAQCELKASANALALVGRHPDKEELVRRLCALAQEELLHYRQVRELLQGRGGQVHRPAPSPYLKGLNSRRMGGQDALLDDLLIAALVEARSCERFVVLVRHLTGGAAPDEELARFYERLAHSESGHALLFLKLARRYYPPERVSEELARRVEQEGRLLESLELGPRMHGGHAPGAC